MCIKKMMCTNRNIYFIRICTMKTEQFKEKKMFIYIFLFQEINNLFDHSFRFPSLVGTIQI